MTPAPTQPSSIEELSATVSVAHAAAQRVGPFDLRRLYRIVEYTPEDLTVTVEAGATLESLQRRLAAHGQWLPIDPPKPAHATLESIVSHNLSGPRRFGFGTIREHLLGLTVVLADGRIIKNGGKVVKNVAGYDLCKLFVGHQGSLGVIVQLTFKIQPLPQAERFLTVQCSTLAAAESLVEQIMASPLMPVVLDLHAESGNGAPPGVTLCLGVAGTVSEVEWQLDQAGRLGIHDSTTLNYEAAFWNDTAPVHVRSVLPSRLAATLAEIAPAPFVARAGNGIIYTRGARPAPSTDSTAQRELMLRIKNLFDPKHLFPDVPT